MLRVICLLMGLIISSHAEQTSFDILKSQIAGQWKGQEIGIRCDHATLENSLKKLPATHVKEIQLSDDKRDFRASVAFTPNKQIIVTGQVYLVSKVPVLKRRIRPGEAIQEKDLTWKKLPTEEIIPQMVLSRQDLVGHTPIEEELEPDEPILKGELKAAPAYVIEKDWISV